MQQNILPEGMQQAADTIIAEIRCKSGRRSRPFLVAIDGGSGAGKSTLAAYVARELGAALVPGDDFFAAEITDAGWDSRTKEQRAADAIDWRRLRTEALEPLLAGRAAEWRAFDFAAGTRPDGTYRMQTELTRVEPAGVVLLDGAFSARPELADLIDLSVLIDVPLAVRNARLAAREDREWLAAWHKRWDAAMEHYFAQVRPRSSFALVVSLE